MTPDMSVSEMLNSFIFVTKGSRVIDRHAADWGCCYWLDEKEVRNLVFSVSDLKRYFAHRVVKSKWKSDRRDPFNDWLTHPLKFTATTLHEAMKLAHMAANGGIEPRIDVEAIIRNARAVSFKKDPVPW